MKISFIGAGKMAGALAAGIVNAGLADARDLCGCARSEASQEKFMKRFSDAKPRWKQEPLEAIAEADLIVLSVKPQQFVDLLSKLKGSVGNALVLSVAAGIRCQQIENGLGGKVRVIRSMPNTPSMVGAGMTAIAAGAYATEADVQTVEKLLASVGKCVRVDESQMNAVTAVSGSGPAYVYHFMNGLIQGGIDQGLSPEISRKLAAQTVYGAAQMVLLNPESPIEMANQVKSPGGTTLAGCAVLEEGGLEYLLQKAVAAARKRADELAG